MAQYWRDITYRVSKQIIGDRSACHSGFGVYLHGISLKFGD